MIGRCVYVTAGADSALRRRCWTGATNEEGKKLTSLNGFRVIGTLMRCRLSPARSAASP